MWKALINYINSRSYRCEHTWKKVEKVRVYFYPTDKMPHTTKHIYRCTKCCESKTIKT